MMLHALMRAIEDVRSLDRLDVLSRSIWENHASGRIDDDTAQRLAEAVQGRRNGMRESRTTGFAPVGSIKSLFPTRRRQRAPAKSVLLERRRTVAASGWLPPAIASRFTLGEQAVLAVILREIVTNKVCTLCVDAIAALAGVSRRLVQSAVCLASKTALLTVEYRPVRGAKNKPNRITVLDSALSAWLARRGGGCRMRHPLSKQSSLPRGVEAVDSGNLAIEMGNRTPVEDRHGSVAGASPGFRAAG